MITFIFILGCLCLSIMVAILSTLLIHALATGIIFTLATIKRIPKRIPEIYYQSDKQSASCNYQASDTKEVNYPKYYIATYYDFWIIRGVLRVIPQCVIKSLYTNCYKEYQDSSINRFPKLLNKESSNILNKTLHADTLAKEINPCQPKKNDTYLRPCLTRKE